MCHLTAIAVRDRSARPTRKRLREILTSTTTIGRDSFAPFSGGWPRTWGVGGMGRPGPADRVGWDQRPVCNFHSQSENHRIAGDATNAYSFRSFLYFLSLRISDKRADDTHADESHRRCYTRPGDPFFVLHLPRFQALAGDRPVHRRCQQIATRFSQVRTDKGAAHMSAAPSAHATDFFMPCSCS
jgi:hypothetical protein